MWEFKRKDEELKNENKGEKNWRSKNRNLKEK